MDWKAIAVIVTIICGFGIAIWGWCLVRINYGEHRPEDDIIPRCYHNKPHSLWLQEGLGCPACPFESSCSFRQTLYED